MRVPDKGGRNMPLKLKYIHLSRQILEQDWIISDNAEDTALQLYVCLYTDKFPLTNDVR